MSKSVKHTPGPWTVIDRKGGPDGNQLARFWVGAGETKWRGPHEVCGISSQVGSMPEPDDPEARANAYLIAAAPEMLDVLIAIGNSRAMDFICDDQILTGLAIEIRNVIAKARGES